MRFYTHHIFPWVVHMGMRGVSTDTSRAVTAGKATGRILEVGFGTGLNLPWYSDRVESITAVDPNPGMKRLAQKQISKSPHPVTFVLADARSLPFEENQFDSVLSSWTLCSIPRAQQALAEIYRVLKPGGRYLFLEHGRSPDDRILKWQNRITPINRIFAGGCHLNRPIRELIETQPWKIEEIREFYEENTPKFAGYLYQGSAVKQM